MAGGVFGRCGHRTCRSPGRAGAALFDHNRLDAPLRTAVRRMSAAYGIPDPDEYLAYAAEHPRTALAQHLRTRAAQAGSSLDAVIDTARKEHR